MPPEDSSDPRRFTVAPSAGRPGNGIAALARWLRERDKAKQLELEHHRRSAARGIGFDDGDDIEAIERKLEGNG